MKIAPIRNEKDYQKALKRLEVIFDAKKGTEKGRRTRNSFDLNRSVRKPKLPDRNARPYRGH